MSTLVIGGGVEQESRDALRRQAGASGVTVIENPLGNRDVDEYVRQEVLPKLGGAGPGDGAPRDRR